MKINISRSELDNDKLLEEMERCEITSNQTAYLFMSQETIDALVGAARNHTVFIAGNTDMDMLAFFCGRRVYKNDDLKFGEVEIR